MKPRHIPFTTVDALGNDFILTLARDLPHLPDPETVLRILDADGGTGTDGWIVLSEADGDSWRIDIYNSDGSTARQCGNGLRCVAKFLAAETGRDHFLIHSPSGEHHARIDREGGVTVGLGRSVVGEEIQLLHGGQRFEGTRVEVGNSHLVITLDKLPDENSFTEVGKALANDRIFGDGINLEMVSLVSSREFSMMIWERGAGPTRACGSGAAAALSVLHERGLVESTCQVKMPGGDLLVTRSSDGQVTICGEATIGVSGELSPTFFR